MTLPEAKAWPVGKVGYVAVVGRPNVGKSTFLNEVLGMHLLAVSRLPQTTRRHWRGILTETGSQIVFIDTPGAHIGKTKLNQQMLAAIMQSLDEANLIVCMVDPTRPCGDEDELVAERVGKSGKPTVLVLNKVDVASPEEQAKALKFYLERLPGEPRVFKMSAVRKQGTQALVDYLREQLPQGHFFFPPDQAIDAIEREIGGEIIREAVCNLLRDEVPHAIAVEVLQWKQVGRKIEVHATLYVERDSQKGIVVGRDGVMIREIRKQAETQLGEVMDARVALKLHVKVARDWRNQEHFLREHGLITG